MLKNSGNTEISYFYLICLSHKDVLRFQIAMQNLPIVNVFNSKTHLDKPVKDLVLCVHDYYNKI